MVLAISMRVSLSWSVRWWSSCSPLERCRSWSSHATSAGESTSAPTSWLSWIHSSMMEEATGRDSDSKFLFEVDIIILCPFF